MENLERYFIDPEEEIALLKDVNDNWNTDMTPSLAGMLEKRAFFKMFFNELPSPSASFSATLPTKPSQTITSS